jgi:uncharacterized protein YcfL
MLMKTKILPLIMALLLVPAFSQRMIDSNASSGEQQETISTTIATQGLINSTTGMVQTMTMSQVRNQIQTAVQNGSQIRMMVQNMSVDVLGGSINVEAPMNHEQKVVMTATMLRLNNETVTSGSGIMAQTKMTIMNQGAAINLTIHIQNGEMNMTQEGVNVRIRNMEMIMENNTMYLNISNKAVEISVVPLQAMAAAKIQNQTRTSAELIVEGETPKYQIREQKNVKVLGLFQARMDVDSKVNALNGVLESQSKPWWSFLATESE